MSFLLECKRAASFLYEHHLKVRESVFFLQETCVGINCALFKRRCCRCIAHRQQRLVFKGYPVARGTFLFYA